MEGANANVEMESNKYIEASAELMFSASDQIETLDPSPEKGKIAEEKEAPNFVTSKLTQIKSQCIQKRGESSSHVRKVEHSCQKGELVTRAMLDEFLVKLEASQTERLVQLEARISHLFEERRNYTKLYHKKVKKQQRENHKLRKRFRMYCDTVARMNNERDEAFERLLNEGKRLIRELSETSVSEEF